MLEVDTNALDTEVGDEEKGAATYGGGDPTDVRWAVVRSPPHTARFSHSMSPTLGEYTGDVLPAALVAAAKEEEVAAMEGVWDVWGVVPVAESLRVTGRTPIKGRWVCCNKGDRQSPDIRARWCAKEVAAYKSDAFFAATSPPRGHAPHPL